jgi:Holliday junction resolvase RusA-like endonuclease
MQQKNDEIVIQMPVPPSVNHYWGRRVGGGVYVRPRGLEFRRIVAEEVCRQRALGRIPKNPLSAPFEMRLCFYDDRRRKLDLDNLLKATLDSLQQPQAMVVTDDYLLDKLQCDRFGLGLRIESCLIVRLSLLG